MNIAIITSTYPRYQGDGAGSFIHSLSRALVQIGHNVTVLAPHDPTIVPGWQSDVDVQRVRYIWPESWSVLGHARSLASDVRLKWHAYLLAILFTIVATFRLRATVIRKNADVIYAQWLVPSGFIGAIVSRMTGAPLVVSLHGSDVFVAERYGFLKPVVHLILKTACHVIACSTDLTSRTVALGLPRDSVDVIPYGVDTERYAPNPLAAQRLRGRLSIPESKKVVMAMGRLVHKKGFSYLLHSVSAVLSEFPDTHFIIAGDGDLRSDLEALATSLGIQEHVLFSGHIPWQETPQYLAMADVFVVPSVLDDAGNLDGLPNVLLESLASGCAVVASNVAGIPEVIKNNANGLLVPQKDDLALSTAICTLLSDPQMCQRLKASARATVTDHLSWEHIAHRIANTLQTCLGKNS